MRAEIIEFPRKPTLERLTANLWLMKLDDTPEAEAQRQHIIEQLRINPAAVIPAYMKECDYESH